MAQKSARAGGTANETISAGRKAPDEDRHLCGVIFLCILTGSTALDEPISLRGKMGSKSKKSAATKRLANTLEHFDMIQGLGSTNLSNLLPSVLGALHW
jgi:hypothetical protein